MTGFTPRSAAAGHPRDVWPVRLGVADQVDDLLALTTALTCFRFCFWFSHRWA